MKLYELTEEFEQAQREMAGMEQQVINDTLDGLKGDIQEKSKNVVAYFLNLDVDIAAMKEAEQKIAKRRKSLESQSTGLKEYLRFNMEASGITKIESPEFKVTLGKPSKICVFDIDLLPENWIAIKQVKSANKNDIKKALKEGAEIMGA
jgi:hypothetical protein